MPHQVRSFDSRETVRVLGNAVTTIVIGKRKKDFGADKASTVLRAKAADLDRIEAEYDAA